MRGGENSQCKGRLHHRLIVVQCKGRWHHRLLDMTMTISNTPSACKGRWGPSMTHNFNVAATHPFCILRQKILFINFSDSFLMQDLLPTPLDVRWCNALAPLSMHCHAQNFPMAAPGWLLSAMTGQHVNNDTSSRGEVMAKCRSTSQHAATHKTTHVALEVLHNDIAMQGEVAAPSVNWQ